MQCIKNLKFIEAYSIYAVFNAECENDLKPPEAKPNLSQLRDASFVSRLRPIPKPGWRSTILHFSTPPWWVPKAPIQNFTPKARNFAGGVTKCLSHQRFFFFCGSRGRALIYSDFSICLFVCLSVCPYQAKQRTEAFNGSFESLSTVVDPNRRWSGSDQ